MLKLKFEVTKWIENNYRIKFWLENQCSYELSIPIREDNTKEYSKWTSKYVLNKVAESNSLQFNNFGKRYKSFAKAVGNYSEKE